MLAALTAGNDLYCWGHAGRAPRALADALLLSDTPSPVVVNDDDSDVLDVAVGGGHMLALTSQGCVFVLGKNSNGQLGLGPGGGGSVSSWTRVNLGSVVVTGVAAGPRNSFLVVRNQNQEFD